MAVPPSTIGGIEQIGPGRERVAVVDDGDTAAALQRSDLLGVDGLTAGDRRVVSDVDVTEYATRRAVVRCTVVKWSGSGATPPADAPRYDNLRLYWRTDDGWQLVSWVNEPSA